ncbi:MAG: TIGR03619 family F420-dependent LLM class oxidoreductase [Acidimicrobiia bacterium]
MGAGAVQFGLQLPWTGHLATRDDMAAYARAAEHLGYGWVSAGEHLIYPKALRARHPRNGDLPIDASSPSHDPFTTFAWLAGQTTTLRFLTGVLLVPLRPALVTAKLVAGLDFVSGGRLTLGVGTGWMEDEFDVLGVEFAERGPRTDDHLAALRSLFEGDGPHDGPWSSFPESWFEPKPVQSPLPIVVGGGAVDPVLRRVARHGQGWWPYPLAAAEIAAAMPRLAEAMAAEGREGEQLEVHTYLVLALDGQELDEGLRRRLVDKVDAAARAGVTHMTLTMGELGGPYGRLPLERLVEAAGWFAREVAPTAPAG